MDISTELTEAFLGKKLTAIERHEFSWKFLFSDHAWLMVESVWRVLSGEHIALTSKDDGQKFGLPTPIDGVAEVTRIFDGQTIQRAWIRKDTGDFSLCFEGGNVLEILITSSGYENWQLGAPDKGLMVIGQGGGELAIFSNKPPTS